MKSLFGALDNLLTFLFIVGIAVLAGGGWLFNIYKLAEYHESLGMSLARLAGIFVAPLGAILGWF